MRFRGAALAGCAAVAAFALGGFVGCSDDEEESDGIFDRDDFSFTFEYPDGFSETEGVETDQQLGNQPVANSGVFITDEDGLLIEEYELNIEVDGSNLEVVQAELDRLFQGVATETPKAKRTEVAGLPALEYDGLEVPTREDATSRFTFIFDGDREYLINCQSTPDAEAEVAEACDLALSTFEVT